MARGRRELDEFRGAPCPGRTLRADLRAAHGHGGGREHGHRGGGPGTPVSLANIQETQPTILFSVPTLFKKVFDGVNKKIDDEKSPWPGS